MTVNTYAEAIYVNAIAADGKGGRFVVDNFSLKHYNADGEIDRNWPSKWRLGENPPGTTPFVNDLVVHRGKLYVSGQFSKINGTRRRNLAALDTRTGKVTSWNPTRSSRQVNASCFSTSTEVSDVAASGERIFISCPDAGSGRKLSAISLRSGKATSWPDVNGIVNTLAISDSRLFVGGAFSRVGTKGRKNLAAISLKSGKATNWKPRVNGGIGVLALGEGKVYVGGGFSEAGDVRRPTGLAAFGLKTGRPTRWNPASKKNVVNGVFNLAVADDRVYLAGDFDVFAKRKRIDLAAVDATTGALLDWIPQTEDGSNDYITTVAVIGRTVYAGTNYFGEYAFDPITGSLL